MRYSSCQVADEISPSDFPGPWARRRHPTAGFDVGEAGGDQGKEQMEECDSTRVTKKIKSETSLEPKIKTLHYTK